MAAGSDFGDRDGLIWMDGKIIPWRDARIHILTHGLHYASSVFEGERAYNNRIFRMQDHSERLIRSAELIDMPMPMSAEQINEAKMEILSANNLTDAYIRPIAWRGSEQLGISAQATKTHMAIACWEWPSYFSKEQRERGINLQTAKWMAPMPGTAATASKTAGIYATHTMSKHAAEAKGFDDALMLDYRGFVAEATGANLFMVKDGAIKTPAPDCFLNGLTRQTVISLAKELKIPLEETHIKPEELHAADEVFLTGTAAELTAVGKIDETQYKVGPVTRQLRDTYESLVRSQKAAAA
ncbi:MAG: branched-chain amino acid aminotransferase [Rhodospirillales bacterium]|nr:branched-chain amino acid aminotransferase [Alphaproteobacteria bacterium]USO03509.1 MAG: branched-chain amino acid aminotransferase [Rhodospirillales bacterium]